MNNHFLSVEISENEFKDFMLKKTSDFGILEDKEEPKYLELVEKFEKELEAFIKLSDDALQKEIDNRYNDEVQKVNVVILEKEKREIHYKALLKKVLEWSPPARMHKLLKRYIINDLELKINDCSTENVKKPLKLSVEDYRKQKLQEIEYNLNCSKIHLKEAIERDKEKELFYQELLNSLPK